MEFIRRNVNGDNQSVSSAGSGGGIINVTSAPTTLATHTIFGQPFNGTQDVKGDLKDANNIVANGNISTDGDLIVKGVDEEGIYNGKDLHISKEDDGSHFTSGEAYKFDNDIYCDTLYGDVQSENISSANIASTLLYSTSIEGAEATIPTINAESVSSTNGDYTTLTSQDLRVDTLTVNKSAHFFNLTIDEVKSVGGLMVISPANATIEKVKYESDYTMCYFKGEDSTGNIIANQFVVGDLVVCHTFNVAENYSFQPSIRYYWRRVIGVDIEDIDGTPYHLIVLSNIYCDKASTDLPKEGDKVALLGNINDATRQNAIIISAYNSSYLDRQIEAPSIVQYKGINGFSLLPFKTNIISQGVNQFKGNFIFTTGENVKDLITSIKASSDGVETRVESLEGEFTSIKQDADTIAIHIGDLEDELNATGIDLEQHKITLNSDNIIINGQTLINDKFIVSEDGNVTMNNATITGEINATSGVFNNIKNEQDTFNIDSNGVCHIGSFEVAGNGLTSISTDTYSGQAGYIICRQDTYNRFAGIGANVMPISSGMAAVARFENDDTSYSYGTNFAAILSASGGMYNFAYAGKGNGFLNGAIEGYAMYPVTLTANTLYGSYYYKANKIFVTCTVSNSGMTLPTLSMMKSTLSHSGDFCAKITYIASSSCSTEFKVYGKNATVKDSSGNYWMDSTSYPQIKNNNGANTDSYAMNKGDVIEFMLVYSGGTYEAYVISRSS